MVRLANAGVVLASASKTRACLLANAGLDFECVPAQIDEAGIREGMEAEQADFRDVAATLAELKAIRVSRRCGPRLVVGADQVLYCRGKIYGKPGDRAGAAAQLAALSGERHTLASAVCVARGGEVIWHHVETAQLAMRSLSPALIERYLDAAGPAVYANAGAYAIEGVGIQLFSAVAGDHFTIQGLPLLPLLGFLREHGVMP